MPFPRSVLVVQPYGIGDLLFLTPVFRALRLIPGLERVDLLLGSRTEAVVRDNPHIDEIYSIDKDLFHRRSWINNAKELWELGKKLRKNRYDLMLDYSFRDEYGFFGLFFFGIAKRAGYARRRKGIFHNVRLPIPQGFSGRHVTEYACELAQKAGVPVLDRFMEFYLARESRELTAEKFAGLGIKTGGRSVVVSPGGGESWGKDAHFKRWPARYFAEFLNRLAKEQDLGQIWILGSSSEKDIGEALKAELELDAVNLMGALSLEESAALIRDASLFVGNDGGLVHLAHALKTPVLAWYGPADPQVYGPYPASLRSLAIFDADLECRPCYVNFRYNDQCETRACLQALTPEKILKIIPDGFLKNALQYRAEARLK